MDNMEKAYELAALAVRQRLAEQHPEDLEVLNRIQPGEVVFYPGSYDQVEQVLQRLKVPADSRQDASDLEAKIVFVNCSGSRDAALVDDLGRHVQEGAWLVTSDWGLQNVLERACPGTVRRTNRNTGDEVISVEPYLESLWSEIVVLGAEPQWWLEGSSYPIQVLDHERVHIEAASHDLLVRYGAPVVAVQFDWGRGHVFHVISHFWHKRSRTPTERHVGPCTDFLRAGMRLTEEGIETVMKRAKVTADSLSFGVLQSAATATELVAQLCIHARKSEK